jgi:hypothetical protein
MTRAIIALILIFMDFLLYNNLSSDLSKSVTNNQILWGTPYNYIVYGVPQV